MRFKDLFFGDIKAQFTKFIPYGFCLTFSILCLYLYLSVPESATFLDDIRGIGSLVTLTLMGLLLILYSLVFLSYGYILILRTRREELKLWSLLGVPTKKIFLILLFEAGIVTIVSYLIGALSGSILSPLFQLIMFRTLELGDFNFKYNPNTLGVIAIFSLFLFLIQAGIAFIYSRPGSLEKIKSSHKRSRRPISGFLSVTSFVALLYFSNEKWISDNMRLLMFTSSFIALYFVISYGFSFRHYAIKTLSLEQRGQDCLSGIFGDRIYSNRLLLYMMTITIFIMVFILTTAYSFMNSSSKITEFHYPYTASYMDTPPYRSDLPWNISGFDGTSTTIEGYRASFNFKNRSNDDAFEEEVLVISKSSFSLLDKEDLKLAPQNAIVDFNLIFNSEDLSSLKNVPIILKDKSGSYEYNLSRAFKKGLINTSFEVPMTIMAIPDNEYKKLSKKNSELKISLINTTDQKSLNDVKESLKSEGHKDDLFLLKNDFHKFLSQQLSIIFVILAVSGSLFFIIAGSVLYLKMKTDMEKTKKRLHTLFLLGMEEFQIRRLVSVELGTVFMTPLLLGLFIGLMSFRGSLSFLTSTKETFTIFFIVGLGTSLLQLILYRISLKKYLENP